MRFKKGMTLIAILLIISLIAIACTDSAEESQIENSTDESIELDEVDETSDKEVEDQEYLDWPAERMGDLPEPQAKVISVDEIEGEGSMYLVLDFDNPDSAKDYLEKLIDMGYEEDLSSEGEDFVMYSGVKRDNSEVILTYKLDDEPGSLIYTEDSSSAKQFFESQEEYADDDDEEVFEIDSENSLDWPKEAMDNIPEIKAEITDISMTEDKTYVSIEFENINKKDILTYIEEIRGLGYTLRTVDSRTSHIISYQASNDKDYTIGINWSENKGYIDYRK